MVLRTTTNHQNKLGIRTERRWFPAPPHFHACEAGQRRFGPLRFVPQSSSSDEPSWTERIPETGPDPEMLCAEAQTSPLVDELRSRASPLLREAFRQKRCDELSNAEGRGKLVLRHIHSNRGCFAPESIRKHNEAFTGRAAAKSSANHASASGSSRNAGARARL